MQMPSMDTVCKENTLGVNKANANKNLEERDWVSSRSSEDIGAETGGNNLTLFGNE